jgi:RHS repeat-associated protein
MGMDGSTNDHLRPDASSRGGALALMGLCLAIASPLASAQAVSLVTTMTYDAGNNVTSVTDPRGLVTTQATDGLGQRWQLVSPDTGTTNFAYDAYGRLASLTRADGTPTTYGYDGLNRKTSVTAGGLAQTFVYDTCTNGLGRLCTDGDAKGATSYSYTPEGWLAGKGFSVVVPGGTPFNYGLGYNYDFEGRLTAVSYPDGNAVTYTRTQGVVSSVSYTIGGTAVTGASAITYRPASTDMLGWTSSNGLTNTLSYDTDGRLTGITVPATQSLGFGYDTANRITQLNNGIDTTLSQTLGYDAQSQLNSVTSGADNESYNYDADGNRVTATVNGAPQTYTYGATNNQLLSFSSILSAQYGYDAMGNTTIINGAPNYQYDAFNRLNSSGGATNYINPEGQRLNKVGGSTGTNYFAPDQSNAMLAESQGSGWTDYVWLNGRLIGRIANGQAYAVHADQVGRPEAVTDASQAVVWRAKNFPFTQTVSLANIPLNLGFPGQYYDAETLTWNNGYRDYNPGFGRYLESDPFGLAGGINTYGYVKNNPLGLTDPYGLWAFSFSGYDLIGGGIELTGAGWHVASISFSGGVGVGGGVSLDPNAPPKNEEADKCAKAGSNAIGLFAKLGASYDGISGGELSAEGGANVSQGGDSHGYGNGGISGPSVSKPGGGAELEAAGGVVITHYF